MGYLLPALTPAKFDNQRDVVLNERRQNYENRPYGLASIALGNALYEPDHPYHWPTIGAPDDLRAAHLDDVQAFFRTYYHPSNASLALAGDISPEEGFDLASRYFGEIEPGPRVEPLRRAAGPASSRRLVLEDRIELPRLYLAWHSPALFAPGDAELDLAADVLANGKTSRLYRSLVFERRIAADVTAAQGSREMSGVFQVIATAASGHGLDELERAIDEELAALAVDGPTDAELERVRTQSEAHFVYRLQTVGGFGGKSDQMNAYQVLLGNPTFFRADLARYLSSTAASIARAMTGDLSRPRVTLSVVPRGRLDLAAADSEPAEVL
jgi:zinc protease